MPDKRSPMPSELGELCDDLACACGWRVRAEAAIVNVYGVRSTMGGHLDDAEPCQASPIVSLSLGLDAIYLIGGTTKATAPTPLLLRSGDVVLHGGPSRRFVHGVPRVLSGTTPAGLRDAAAKGIHPDDHAVGTWLQTHRINVNVRQCWPTPAAPEHAPAAPEHAPMAHAHELAAPARAQGHTPGPHGSVDTRGCSSSSNSSSQCVNAELHRHQHQQHGDPGRASQYPDAKRSKLLAGNIG